MGVCFITGMLTVMFIYDFIYCTVYPEGQSALLRVTSASELIIGRAYGAARASVDRQHWGDLFLLRVGSSLAGAARRGVGMFLRCAKTGSPM